MDSIGVNPEDCSQMNWLVICIALSEQLTQLDEWLRRYEIKYRCVKEIFDYLKAQDLITD